MAKTNGTIIMVKIATMKYKYPLLGFVLFTLLKLL